MPEVYPSNPARWAMLDRLPTALYRADQVRELDKLAIERGISGARLMNRAAAALFRVVRRHWPASRKLVIFCGGGNNGGDGYCLGRLAIERGFSVELIELAEPSRLRGDAADARSRALAVGLSPMPSRTIGRQAVAQ